MVSASFFLAWERVQFSMSCRMRLPSLFYSILPIGFALYGFLLLSSFRETVMSLVCSHSQGGDEVNASHVFCCMHHTNAVAATTAK